MANCEAIQTPPSDVLSAATAAAMDQHTKALQHDAPFSSSSPSSSPTGSDTSSLSQSSSSISTIDKNLRCESTTSSPPRPLRFRVAAPAAELPTKKPSSISSANPISLSPVPESLLYSAQSLPPDWLRSAQAGHLQWTGQGGLFCQTHAKWLEDETSLGTKLRVGLLPHVQRLPGGCCAEFSLSFFAQGSWNRVYLLQHCTCHPVDPEAAQEYIVRVALPIFPRLKMEAEVATIEFVRRYTPIPTPVVFMYNSDASNPVGYEWMVMERMAGVPYYDVVDKWSQSQKEQLAYTLADWIDSLSRLKFREIGSLYRANTAGDREGLGEGGGDGSNEGDAHFIVGPVVTQEYSVDWRLEYIVGRGPFSCAADFARSFVHSVAAEAIDSRQLQRADLASLRDKILGFEKGLRDDPDGLLCDAARRCLHARRDAISNHSYSLVSFDSSRYYRGDLPMQSELCSRLLRIIQAVIPNNSDGEEDINNSNVLHHWDISAANVLVDPATGEVTGLLDWEQVHTVPLLVPNFFPTIMDLDGTLPDVSQLSVYDEGKGKEKDEWRLEREDRWDAQCMRAAFTARLEELSSPWLATKDNEQQQQFILSGAEENCGAVAATIDPQEQLQRLRSKVLQSAMQTTFSCGDMSDLEKEARNAGFL